MEKPLGLNLFWHICSIGRWKEVVSDQLETLRSSGLLSELDRIHVTLLGESDSIDFLNEPKMEVRIRSENIRHYESLCLNDMRKWCESNDSKVLYIHSKGVSRSGSEYENVWEWRKMMEYFLIENWRECVAALDKHDTVGCNVSSCGFGKHYSGNFWWSKSSYLSRLQNVEIKEEDCGFWRCETWIMTGDPLLFEAYRDQETQHYYDRVPKNYKRQDR